MSRPRQLNLVVGKLYPAVSSRGYKFKAQFACCAGNEYEFIIPSGIPGSGRRIFYWNGYEMIGLYCDHLKILFEKKTIKGKKARTGKYILEKIS